MHRKNPFVVMPDLIRHPGKILPSVLLSLIICTPIVSYADTLSRIWNDTLVPYPTMNPDDQAVCAQDDKGNSLLSINQDKVVIPASVSKIYTEDFAFAKLGHDYTFKTAIVRKGTTIYINGNLDPFFTDGDLKKIILSTNTKLVNPKIEHVVFTKTYFNWSESQTQTKINLQKFVKQSSLFTKKADVTYRAFPYTGLGNRYTFTSPPLYILFKQTNIYSTNSSTHALFLKLGGHDAFQKYMKDTYGVGEETTSFYTGSGLEDNATTCRMTITVLKHLHQYLIAHNIRAEDFLSFPRLDGGSMRNRMKNITDPTRVLVKPGFVYNHETLAGIAKTSDGFVYFGIFTTYPNQNDVNPTRVLIDTFTEKILEYVNALPFEYTKWNYVQDNWTKVG